MGYTVFMVCTSIISFITILNWQYSKTLKVQMKKRGKPLGENICPRCGVRIDRNEKYCSKCGKKISTRKR